MGKNIGFISTRFAGIDGVSLEASKWAEVLENSGHQCFWFAGELDKSRKDSMLVPEAHFHHPHNIWINKQVFGKTGRKPDVTELIHDLRSYLKAALQKYIDHFKLDLLVIENAIAIPLNLPLGIALTELLSETQIPTIAHHHDMYWERTNFLVNSVGEYLRMAFPPNLPNIEHVVINSLARDELARRRGILATIIPNVLDFEKPPNAYKNGYKNLRRSFGLNTDDRIILQPTRIVRRKGIEHTIELVKALDTSDHKLLISHEAGDEGFEYAEWIKHLAQQRGVDLRLARGRISSPWDGNGNPSKDCCLWNVYNHADFICYPSLYEGFGNALLEAIYFKKPLMINRYAIFVKDIEPKGFDLVSFDGYLSTETVNLVKEIMESSERRKKMVNSNYEIAKQHYSYATLRKQLSSLSLGLFARSDSIQTPMNTVNLQNITHENNEPNLIQMAV
jgi:glycosyltransferase involved in cell wall biosynthesis